MRYFTTLLQRFGLRAPATDTSEAFGLRLDRLETREGRREVRKSAFDKGDLKNLA